MNSPAPSDNFMQIASCLRLAPQVKMGVRYALIDHPQEGDMHKKLALIGAIMGLSATAAGAQDKVKVGVIATLSGPPAVLGQQLRNGFQLAVEESWR